MSDAATEYGLAQYVLPGQAESGDLQVYRRGETNTLIAVIDGIGHGDAAANAAKAAAEILESRADDPVIALAQQCHENLKTTRGVVMSLASIDHRHGLMTWLGVGNVQGLLLRARPGGGAARETLLLRAGVIGSQLPSLQAAVLTVAKGDTLIFVTDGIRGDFGEDVSVFDSAARQAERILKDYCRGNDDALVLVVKLMGKEK